MQAYPTEAVTMGHYHSRYRGCAHCTVRSVEWNLLALTGQGSESKTEHGGVSLSAPLRCGARGGAVCVCPGQSQELTPRSASTQHRERTQHRKPFLRNTDDAATHQRQRKRFSSHQLRTSEDPFHGLDRTPDPWKPQHYTATHGRPRPSCCPFLPKMK